MENTVGNKKPKFIVLMAMSEQHHKELVDMLRPAIGVQITYIDIAPEVVHDDHDGTLLKVDV